MLKQLVSYNDKQFLLLSTFSGFRKGHSTVTVLLGIRDQLIRVMSRGEVKIMVCVDISKAFDMVKLKSVLTKLHLLRFPNCFLRWLLSYLGERPFVQIDARKSDFAVVEFGVPQGSVLGPFIFNLYVADLQDSLQCPYYQYADDTTFFLHSKVSELDACTEKSNCPISRLLRAFLLTLILRLKHQSQC